MLLKISIITATYNSASTISDTLQSVASQTYPNIEHIIVDGLSSDNTLQIVKNFPHISKVISEKDKGIYDAMNKGIALATGDLIGILNSDDFYTNYEVLSQVITSINNPTFDGCYADLNYVHPLHTSKIMRKWRSGSVNSKSFLLGWMPPHPTVFLKKDIYQKFGTFNTALRSSADYELMLRLIVKHHIKLAYLPKTIVSMRTGGQSNATFNNRIKAHKEDKIAWQINNLKPYFFTLYLKPLRKIFQFI